MGKDTVARLNDRFSRIQVERAQSERMRGARAPMLSPGSLCFYLAHIEFFTLLRFSWISIPKERQDNTFR